MSRSHPRASWGGREHVATVTAPPHGLPHETRPDKLIEEPSFPIPRDQRANVPRDSTEGVLTQSSNGAPGAGAAQGAAVAMPQPLRREDYGRGDRFRAGE